MKSKLLKRILSAGVAALTAAILLSGCVGNNGGSMSSRVKTLGRTYEDADSGTIWLTYSASGVEFAYENCTSCTIELVGDAVCAGYDEKKHARYAVEVNGERVVDALLGSASETVSVPLKEANGTVRVLKLSEVSDSCMGIKSIETDGKIKKTEQKNLKIEFIGDSITCGYGVDGTLHDSYQTGLEDATKAYAYQTAQLLDADYSLVSMSGYGIYTGYAYAGKPIPEQTMGLYYTTLGNSQGRVAGLVVKDQKWDFSKFKADYVVINLGTNDASYCKTAETKALYVDAYVEFLKLVRENNKDAVIICALGIMGQDLCGSMQEAITKYSAQTGDTKVLYQKLDNQSGEYAVDYHPTEASHQKAAKQMADFISMLENQ